MKFTVNNKEIFHKIFQYTILIKGKIILVEQPSKFSCPYEGACYTGFEIFSNSARRLTSLVQDKAEFIVASSRHFSIHTFHSVDKFLMFKIDS